MTVDLEPDLRSKNCKSIELVLPKLLEFFDQQNIKATFFTVTSLLEKYESEIKEIAKKHEIASHSHTHSWLNKNNAEYEISQSKKILEEHNLKCFGFRAPKFITTKNHFSLLRKYNYQYDSSFTNKTFQINTINNISSFRFPSPSSGLSYRKLLHPISKFFPQSKLFYLHPWEFLKKSDLPKATSLTPLLLKRNSGKKAWNLFQNIILRHPHKWISCKEYLTIINNK